MSTTAAVATAGPVRVVHRLVLPLLALETMGLVGLATSWIIAGIAAIVLSAVAVLVRALRRASQRIDTILDEELTAAKQDVNLVV